MLTLCYEQSQRSACSWSGVKYKESRENTNRSARVVRDFYLRVGENFIEPKILALDGLTRSELLKYGIFVRRGGHFWLHSDGPFDEYADDPTYYTNDVTKAELFSRFLFDQIVWD